MTIANVAWVVDRRGRPVLELDLDGHPAHIRGSQRAELLRRGIVAGMASFASERSGQFPNPSMRGAGGPDLGAADLVGCTDDRRGFALSEDMSRAVLGGTWRAGPRAPVA